MKKILLSFVAAMSLAVSASAQADVKPVKGNYTGELYVALGAELYDESTLMPVTTVTITAGDTPGTINFQLPNFSFNGLQLGDIYLPNLPLNEKEGEFTFGENAPVNLSFLGGAIVADASIDSTRSTLNADSVTAYLPVYWIQSADAKFPIYVLFKGKANSLWQLKNTDFNGEWEVNRPWDSKTEGGYWTPNKEGFVQPSGWVVANVSGIGGLGATIVGKQDTVAGDTTNFFVTLANTPNPMMKSQIVPGYMNLGISWATAKASISSVSKADGGAFGGMKFNGLPDALSFKYKRSHGTANAEEPATVVAYMWKGQYSQADVPANTALFADGTPVTMIDRDRNILNMETAEGGEVTKSADAALIASINQHIEGDAEEWTSKTIEFNYEGDEVVAPEKINLIFSANDYFGDRTTMGVENSLSIDDVELVYYHGLSSLSYNGAELSTTSGDTIVISTEKALDPEMISYEKTGRGSVVEISASEDGKEMKILVKGNDYCVNPGSFTEYVLISKLGTGIEEVSAEGNKAEGVYTLGGVRVADKMSDNLPKGIYIVGNKKVIK